MGIFQALAGKGVAAGRLRAAGLVLAASLVGCGGGQAMGGALDAGDDAEQGLEADGGAGYPAVFPAPPQVLNEGHGEVLHDPIFVPVFFSNYDASLKASLKDFVAKVGSTPYWTATTAEYGVGEGLAIAPVELKEAATGTLDSATISSWLEARLNANDPALPRPTDQMIYILFYPEEVTITMKDTSSTSMSCQSFGGYHGDLLLDIAHGGLPIAYAVIPTCPKFGMQVGVDAVTATLSHELIEAATDPHPKYDPAFASVDEAHLYWGILMGGAEVSDMCAQEDAAFARFGGTGYAGFNYVVQRSWSNVAARAGRDPCVPPLPRATYFNAAPELPDTITLAGGMYAMPGVSLAIGESKTIPVALFSEAPLVSAWGVTVRDAASFFGSPAALSLHLDRSSGKNGDHLMLTVKRVAAGQYGAPMFYLESKIGTQVHRWFGIVAD